MIKICANILGINRTFNYSFLYDLYVIKHINTLIFQATRKALSAERVNDIWEKAKDMGVLLGKGGLYSNVSVTPCDYVIFVN